MLGEFIREMQVACPEIVDIDMIPYPDGTLGSVYLLTSDDHRIPLYAAGDGTRRWFHLLGHMLVNKNACHCIEEIDSTFHPRAQEGLSQFLVKYAKQFDNQLFITSHSIEFTDTFLELLYGEQGFLKDESEDPVRLYTIKRPSMRDVPEVWVLTGRDAYEKRKDYALELR
jgi:predicted ATPase